MKQPDMNNLASYFGSLGIGFLIAGALLWALQRASEIYWASFLIVGLALCTTYIATRWKQLAPALGSRSAKEGANSAVLIGIVVGIVGLSNYIADEHAEQWDVTTNRQYSLSDQTTKILADLDSDVVLILLDRRGSPQQIRTEDLLKLYDDASDRLDIIVIDPEVEPEKALRYASPTEPLALGTILIETDGRQQRVAAATEAEITSSLIRALKNETKKIYFTSGHQEKDLLDTDGSTGISIIAGKLEGSAYRPEALVIARSANEGGESVQIPDDTAALVIAGPGTDFLQEELDALDAYIDSGGGVIFLIDPDNQGLAPELVALLVERGVVLGQDVVVDALAQPPIYPVVQSYTSHAIVENFGNVMSIFPLARSVRMGEHVPDGVDMRELFTTADENSWAETNLEELNERGGPASEQDRGPIGLAMALTIDRGEDTRPSRLVAVGDSDFIANELAAAPLLNADLFLNMVNWVAQDEDLISIRPREAEERGIALNSQQQQNMFYLSLFIIPGIVVITGVSLWWGRR